MAKFAVIKQLDLEYIGKEWTGCYLKFREPTAVQVFAFQKLNKNVEEIEKSLAEVVGVLQSCFIDGKAFNGVEVVSVKAEDLNLNDMSISIIMAAVNFLVRGLSVMPVSTESEKKPL